MSHFGKPLEHPAIPWVSIHLAALTIQVPVTDLRNMVTRKLLTGVEKSGPEKTRPLLLSFHHMIQAYYALTISKENGMPLLHTNEIGLKMVERFDRLHGAYFNEDLLYESGHGLFFYNHQKELKIIFIEDEDFEHMINKMTAAGYKGTASAKDIFLWNDKFRGIASPRSYIYYPHIDTAIQTFWNGYSSIDLDLNRLAVEGRLKHFPKELR